MCNVNALLFCAYCVEAHRADGGILFDSGASRASPDSMTLSAGRDERFPIVTCSTPHHDVRDMSMHASSPDTRDVDARKAQRKTCIDAAWRIRPIMLAPYRGGDARSSR